MKAFIKIIISVLAVGLSIAIYDHFSFVESDENVNTVLNVKAKKKVNNSIKRISTTAKETPVFLKEQNEGVSIANLRNSFNDKTFVDNLSEKELRDVTKVPEVLIEVTKNGMSLEDLGTKLHDAGYNPKQEKHGHVKTGFRRELKVGKQNDGLLLDVYSSYLEHDGLLYFDRLYLTYEGREDVFHKLVNDLDKKLDKTAINKIVRDGYVRWNLPGEKFVFIDSNTIRDGERVVFVGHEFEIH